MASVWPASTVEVLILLWRKQRLPQATIRRDRRYVAIVEQIGQFVQPVVAAWRGHEGIRRGTRVERLVRLFSVEPGNEGAYAILLPMAY
jgi:hypothetical protein